MKHRIFSFLLSLVLLVSAQTALATAYFSASTPLDETALLATSSAGKWKTVSCAGTTQASALTIDYTADTFSICPSHTLTISNNVILSDTGAAGGAAGGSVITTMAATTTPVAAAGTLVVAAGKKLTLGTSGAIANNGIITLNNSTGEEAIVVPAGISGSGVINNTCQSAVAGGAWGTAATWGSATTSCGFTHATTAFAVPTANSTVIIAGSVATPTMSAPVTLSGSSTASAKSVTIAAGGKLNHISSSALTIKGNLTNNATAAGDVALGPVIFDSTAASVGGSQTTTFTGLLTVTGTGGALTLAGSTILNGGFTLTSPGTITLASTNTVGGDVTTYGSAISGVLKFGAGNKIITASDASVVIPAVDVSAMLATQTITVGATNGIKFTNVLGGTLTTSVPAAYVLGATIAAAAAVTVTPTPAVSAPIFSSKEKAKVFVEEVNH